MRISTAIQQEAAAENLLKKMDELQSTVVELSSEREAVIQEQ